MSEKIKFFNLSILRGNGLDIISKPGQEGKIVVPENFLGESELKAIGKGGAIPGHYADGTVVNVDGHVVK